jgi:periplasmic protein TonB
MTASLLDVPRGESKGAPAVAALGAVLVHAGALGLALLIGVQPELVSRTSALVSEMVEVELPPPPEPPPPEPPPPEPPPPEPPSKVIAPSPRPVEPTPEAPPPEAAQAGQVLAAAEEVVDFGDTFVAGQGTTYAGGVTENGGTRARAVRDANARAGGVPGGTGTNLAGDLSRPPRLAGAAEWDCPFPIEADDAGIDDAVVTLRVDVGIDGKVTSAVASSDPGHGFGREARRCALRKRWSPGLDRAGRPIDATSVVNVRFQR